MTDSVQRNRSDTVRHLSDFLPRPVRQASVMDGDEIHDNATWPVQPPPPPRSNLRSKGRLNPGWFRCVHQGPPPLGSSRCAVIDPRSRFKAHPELGGELSKVVERTACPAHASAPNRAVKAPLRLDVPSKWLQSGCQSLFVLSSVEWA